MSHPLQALLLAVSTALTLTPPIGADEARAPLDIRVTAHKAWGSSPERVQAILASAANELWQHFPRQPLKPILVEPLGGPITLFERGPGGEYRVQLDTGDNLWAQWVYQFAHEFGHILSSYDSVNHKNKWFEEMICEVASLYVLQRLSVNWAKDGMPGNWKSFSRHLEKYADDRKAKAKLPEDMTLAQWFPAHAATLARSGYDREKNTVVAVQLLPLFDESPENWAAITYLAKAKKGHGESLPEFLKAWQSHCPEKHRMFVAAIARKFGIDLAKVELKAAPAEGSPR